MRIQKHGNLQKTKKPMVAIAQTAVEVYDVVYKPVGTMGTVIQIAKVVLPMV